MTICKHIISGVINTILLKNPNPPPPSEISAHTDKLTAPRKNATPAYQRNLQITKIEQAQTHSFKVLKINILRLNKELAQLVKVDKIDENILQSLMSNLNTINKDNSNILNHELEKLPNILKKYNNEEDENKFISKLKIFFNNIKIHKELIIDITLILAALGIKQAAWYGTQFIKNLSFFLELMTNHAMALPEFIASIISFTSLINNKFDVSFLNALVAAADFTFLFPIQYGLHKELMKPKHYISLSLIIFSSLIINNAVSFVIKSLFKNILTPLTNKKSKQDNDDNSADTNLNNYDLESSLNNLTPRQLQQIIANIANILDETSSLQNNLNTAITNTNDINNTLNALKQDFELNEEDSQFIDNLQNKLSGFNNDINNFNEIFSQLTNYFNQKYNDINQMAKDKPYHLKSFFFIVSAMLYTILLSASAAVKNPNWKIPLAAIASVLARIPAWFFLASKNDNKLKEFLSSITSTIKDTTEKVDDKISSEKLNSMISDIQNKLSKIIPNKDSSIRKLTESIPEKNKLMAVRIFGSWAIFAFFEYIALTKAHHEAKENNYNLITSRVQMEFFAIIISKIFDIVILAKTPEPKDTINLLSGLSIWAAAFFISIFMKE